MTLYTTSPRTSSRVEASPSSRECPPPDFNAGMYPILAAHWFGIAPNSPIAAALGFELPIEHITRLRPRTFGTALALAGPGVAA